MPSSLLPFWLSAKHKPVLPVSMIKLFCHTWLISYFLLFVDYKSNRAFEDTIIATVECVRAEMNVGWPDYGIPHFNPLMIEDLDLDLSIVDIEGIS